VTSVYPFAGPTATNPPRRWGQPLMYPMALGLLRSPAAAPGGESFIQHAYIIGRQKQMDGPDVCSYVLGAHGFRG